MSDPYTHGIVETRVKERLTGALILVAALVILVPEIFSGRRVGETSGEPPPAAPPTDGPPLRTYTAELTATAPARELPEPDLPVPPPELPQEPSAPPVSAPTPAPAPAPRPAPAAPAVASREPAPAPRPAPQAPAAAPSRAAQPASGGWYVQVGSFGQAANAQRVAEQLRDKGFNVQVLPASANQKLIRVRVGPARDRDGAVDLQKRLAAAGHQGTALVAP